MIVSRSYANRLIRAGRAEAWRTREDGEILLCKIADADRTEWNGNEYAIVLDLEKQRTLHVLIG